MSDISGDALGFLETEGLVAAIEASDAMVKAANVELRAKRTFGGGRVCLMVRGDLASCQAAIEAGKAMATAFGGFLYATVLARPDPDSEALWAKHMPATDRRKKERAAKRRAALSGAAGAELSDKDAGAVEAAGGVQAAKPAAKAGAAKSASKPAARSGAAKTRPTKAGKAKS